jgi:hypothetical protein
VITSPSPFSDMPSEPLLFIYGMVQLLAWTAVHLSGIRSQDIREAMSHYLECLRSGEWCPLCYEGKKGRAAHRGHFGFRPHRKVVTCMPLLKRETTSSTPGSTGAAADGSTAFWKRLPDLYAFLSVSSWPDGKSRVPGTVLIFTDGSVWKCCLNDKDQNLVAFVSGPTIEKALEAAEKAVGDPGADWRVSQGKGKRR